MAPSLIDVVLASLRENRLAREQVTMLAELVGEEKVLVEFSDERGRASAVARPRWELLVLHCVPQAA